MITLKCVNCDKDMLVQGVFGSVPINIPMHNYCSEKCVNEAIEKNKIPPEDKEP